VILSSRFQKLAIFSQRSKSVGGQDGSGCLALQWQEEALIELVDDGGDLGGLRVVGDRNLHPLEPLDVPLRGVAC